MSIGGTFAEIEAKTFIRRLSNWVYVILRSIFKPLEDIWRQFEVLLPRYGPKRLFAVFEIGFTTFAVLFLYNGG